MKHHIALVGFGTVGQGLAEILLSKRLELLKHYGFDFDIVAISDLTFGTAFNPKGLDITSLLNNARAKQCFSQNTVPWDALTMIKESNATIICELAYTNLKTGEPAISHCQAAFASGKHIVTSNKGPAALAYRQLSTMARQHHVKFMIEGTVMSGTPVLNLANSPLAGCNITAAQGILNGTTNYILTQMETGMSYANALKKAQELGYAEADPSGDVEGYDTRGKVTILANVVMNYPLPINDVSCQGITHITPNDINQAKKENYRWKLIGSIQTQNNQISASVAPQMLPLSHPLASVMGATNAITFSTDLLGDVSIIGPGAGKTETGFAILADLLSIHHSSTD